MTTVNETQANKYPGSTVDQVALATVMYAFLEDTPVEEVKNFLDDAFRAYLGSDEFLSYQSTARSNMLHLFKVANKVLDHTEAFVKQHYHKHIEVA